MRYRDRDVTLSGRVVESISVADRGAYRIDDRTGQIWIISSHGVPRKGATVKLSGQGNSRVVAQSEALATRKGKAAEKDRVPRSAFLQSRPHVLDAADKAGIAQALFELAVVPS